MRPQSRNNAKVARDKTLAAAPQCLETHKVSSSSPLELVVLILQGQVHPVHAQSQTVTEAPLVLLPGFVSSCALQHRRGLGFCLRNM